MSLGLALQRKHIKMNQYVDLIEEIQLEVIYQEISYDDIKTLNEQSNSNDNVIMYCILF